MKVLVAGATGVLGRALVPLLLDCRHTVRACARNDRPPDGDPRAEHVACDLLTQPLEPVAAGCDAVVHIATAVPRQPDALGAWEATGRLRTEGTRRLLDASLNAGCARYVQQSIIMAYPDGGDRWLDESTPLDTSPTRSAICGPVIEMEEIIRNVDPARIAWTILRGGRFVGRGTAEDDLIKQLELGTATIPGEGSNFVSLVDVQDMAAAVVAAIEVAPPASILNIVDEPVRYSTYADRLAEILGVPHPTRDSGATAPPSWRCTNLAARPQLGWVPSYGIWPRR